MKYCKTQGQTRFRHWSQKQHTLPVFQSVSLFIKTVNCWHRNWSVRLIQRDNRQVSYWGKVYPLVEPGSQKSDREQAGKCRNGEETGSITGAETNKAGRERGSHSEKQHWKVRKGAQTNWQGTRTKPGLKYGRTQVSLTGWCRTREPVTGVADCPDWHHDVTLHERKSASFSIFLFFKAAYVSFMKVFCRFKNDENVKMLLRTFSHILLPHYN